MQRPPPGVVMMMQPQPQPLFLSSGSGGATVGPAQGNPYGSAAPPAVMHHPHHHHHQHHHVPMHHEYAAMAYQQQPYPQMAQPQQGYRPVQVKQPAPMSYGGAPPPSRPGHPGGNAPGQSLPGGPKAKTPQRLERFTNAQITMERNIDDSLRQLEEGWAQDEDIKLVAQSGFELMKQGKAKVRRALRMPLPGVLPSRHK